MINERAKYTANLGAVTISTANSNLDGTGTISTLITGASNGTFVQRIFIKAGVSTTQGMIRIFLFDGTKTRLIKEIPVFPTTKSSINSSFRAFVPIALNIASGYSLKLSTQNAETFYCTAEGFNWTY
ncbi:MAG: hypothetical protein J0L87_08090 [Bacteroidetes bacterium]|nr:hypothetical protein [Bacteroidota bacterium]